MSDIKCLGCNRPMKPKKLRRYHLKCFDKLHNDIEDEIIRIGRHSKRRQSTSKRQYDPLKALGSDYVGLTLAGMIRKPEGAGSQIYLIDID